MCTPGILDSLVVALRLLSSATTQHIIVTLYSRLFVKAYCSIIKSKKPLIVALVDRLGTPSALTKFINDVLKAFFNLTLYLVNRTTLIKLSIVLPLFVLIVKDKQRRVV
ncbi:U-box domain-containing protein [Musa troglodytarum]|nr:U-box domain-containing protein [Musa troglodytarum]